MRNLMSEDTTQGTLAGLLCAVGVVVVLVLISAIARTISGAEWMY